MKAPINCPVCGDPMLNIFPPAEDLSDKLTKTCNRRLNHKIAMDVSGDNVNSLSIDLGSGLEAVWLFYPDKQVLWVVKALKGSHVLHLPWVEPNLAQYSKLVNKLRTYVVFS